MSRSKLLGSMHIDKPDDLSNQLHPIQPVLAPCPYANYGNGILSPPPSSA